MQNSVIEDLLTLSHEIGREDRGLALLGEGNTSARLTKDTYLVKASGSSLGTLRREDVVVSNAAILIAEPIIAADAEKWRAVMNVNLFGYFLVTKHACRIMKQRRSGSIININSKSG